MHGRFHLVGQNGIDAALALDAGDTLEGGRDDADVEMGFAARSRAGMAGMASALVAYDELDRREAAAEFPPDRVGNGHKCFSGVPEGLSSNSFSCFFTFRYHNRAMAKEGTRARFKADIRIKPDQPQAPTTERLRPCARAGCEDEGAFRVPKSRDDLSSHIFLCLAHAREHNESWDYFKGMNERDIESFRNDAVTGHRPTWPLGKRSARMHNPFGNFHVDDPHGSAGRHDASPQPRRPERQISRLQMQAFDALGLEPSATLNAIKARYKELVKRFHPDANGGDRGAEERLKQVIKAYGVLRASGLT